MNPSLTSEAEHVSNFISLPTSELAFKDAYKLMIGTILPRPIAFVSTQSPEGKLNLAPYSFFNGVCSNPPTILFCPVRRGTDGTKKDTLLNIEATGEFVVHVVSEDIVEQMNQTSADYEPEVSEFEAAGLTPIPSHIVKPPRVKESPVAMECKLDRIIDVGDGSPGSGCVVLGQVVCFHVREDLYEGGRVNTNLLKPVSRLAGAFYAPVREAFELPRPVI